MYLFTTLCFPHACKHIHIHSLGQIHHEGGKITKHTRTYWCNIQDTHNIAPNYWRSTQYLHGSHFPFPANYLLIISPKPKPCTNTQPHIPLGHTPSIQTHCSPKKRGHSSCLKLNSPYNSLADEIWHKYPLYSPSGPSTSPHAPSAAPITRPKWPPPSAIEHFTSAARELRCYYGG